MLPPWHVKDPGHSAKSAGGRLHLNTHTPLTQRSRGGLTIPLPGHSVETYSESSSHATCQGTFGHSCFSSLSHCGLWTDPGRKSEISVCELISTSKKRRKKEKKGAGGESMVRHSPQILLSKEKATSDLLAEDNRCLALTLLQRTTVVDY